MNKQKRNLKKSSSSKTSPSLPKRSMKTCRVCGENDSKIAFNYEGLSCDSCKSFFYRTVRRELELFCTNNNNACEITIKTRIKCPKCRLQKCFKIGMRKELIALSKFKTEIFQKIASNDQEIAHIKHELLNSINLNPRALRSHYTNNMDELQFPSLSKHERAKLEEVSGYFKSFKEEASIKTAIPPPEREEFLKICDEYGHEVVRTIKNIPVMKSYSMKDKMTMARGFVKVFCNLRYSLNRDIESGSSLMLEIKEQKECYHVTKAVWAGIMPDHLWDQMAGNATKNHTFLMGDPMIRDLAATLSLFRHDDRVSCPEVLRLHYLEYYYLLRRYLQVKLRTKKKFEKHMILLHDLIDRYPIMLQYARQFYEIISPHFSLQLFEEIYKG